MKFLAIILLSCWSGAALGSGAMTGSSTFNWPLRYDCNKKPDFSAKQCGRDVYERRYYYDSDKNKCILFVRQHCNDDATYGKFFEKRKRCMRTCMPEGSLCLKFRKGQTNGTFKGYSYDAHSDICYPARYKSEPKFWPRKNIFRTEQECYDECAPEDVQRPPANKQW
uniref:Putative kunitz-type serine protease inhibitor n=1 Tax=Amblyomma cajennense TaxID=34607 RepID=A0A023FQD6_AMBCJ